jgi:hypothetical protein
MARERLPYLTKPGFYAVSIGHQLKEGKRTQRRFSLGSERSAAYRKTRALCVAWDEETTTDAQGKKVWSEENVRRALAFAEPGSWANDPALRTLQPSTSRAPVPVFAPDPPPQPTFTPASFTLPQAMDEYGRFFSGRTDTGEKHRAVIASRLKSIKAHIEDISAEVKGTRVWLKDLPMSQVDAEWLTRIRNRITSRSPTRFINTSKREGSEGRPREILHRGNLVLVPRLPRRMCPLRRRLRRHPRPPESPPPHQ